MKKFIDDFKCEAFFMDDVWQYEALNFDAETQTFKQVIVDLNVCDLLIFRARQIKLSIVELNSRKILCVTCVK